MTTVTIKGIDGVRKMLRQYTNPEFTKRMKRAVKSGGTELKDPLRSASAQVSKRMAKAVTVVQSPKGLVGKLKATNDPHVYIGYRRKDAPFAHIVIGGSKDHGPRSARVMQFHNDPVGAFARHVRGVRANPIVAKVAATHGDKAYSAVWRDLDKTEK